MKKQIVCILLPAILVLLTAVALAAPVSPLADVPAGHWSYSSLDKLVNANIISGYQGKFNDGKTLTRLEMARIVAKAMATMDNAEPDVKREVSKLAKEFARELDNYLIRIEEQRPKADKIQFSGGEARLEYESSNVEKNGNHTGTTISRYYIRSTLDFRSAINDDWKFNVKFRADQKFRTSGTDQSHSSFLNQVHMRGPVGPFDVQIGRWYTGVMDTLMWDDYADGIRIKFGDRVKTTLSYGYHALSSQAVYYDKTNAATQARGNYIAGTSTRTGNSKTEVTGLEMDYDFTPDTQFYGYMFRLNAPNLAANYPTRAANYWGGKLEQNLGKDLKASLIIMRSDAETDNQANLIGLSYKETNKTRPGSYKYYVEYGTKERFASFDSSKFAIYASDTASDYHSRRVWRLGADYVPKRNIEWVNYVDFGKATDGSGYKEFYIRSRMYFYF